FQAVGKITTTTFELDGFLDSIMDLILKTMRVDAGSLLFLNEETGLLEFKVAKGSKAEEVKQYKFAIGEGIVGWVAESGQSKVIPEVIKEEHFKKDVAENINYPVSNIMCVPLKVNEKIIGVIEVMNTTTKKRFIKEDLDLLESLAGQISLVVQNAKLFTESTRKINALSTIMQVSSVINSTLNLNRLLSSVMESAAKLLNAETSTIFLIDQEKQELYFEVVTGKTKESISQIRVPMNEGIAGWVSRSGQPLLVPDVSKDSRFYKKVDEKSKFATKSIIAVPLKVKDKIIGVIEVLNKKDGAAFLPYEMELLVSLADQSAVAIDNAIVHREFQELFLNTITSLARAIESKDPYTGGHIDRIESFSLAIVDELEDLTYDDRERIRWAALFHDLGKIGVDEFILRKPGKLTDDEYAQIKKHPELGANILKPIKQFKHIIPGILHHQERWDGRGYPAGLKGEEISIDGRIIGVADTYDAMTSDRPYRKGLPKEVAVAEIFKCSGSQFDPIIVTAFMKACKKETIKPECEMNK
ncbi:MAG: GAF domain-containing protein, partial [Candidatus Firestonebacteria bacterium]